MHLLAFRRLTSLLMMCGVMCSVAYGQNEDDAETNKAKAVAMIDELRKEESEMRDKNVMEVNKKRELSIASLEALLKKYRSQNREAEGDLISKQIENLKLKLAVAKKNAQKKAKHNQYFSFNKNYFFDEQEVIRGKFIFMSNGKLRALYNYQGKQESRIWNWEDKGDHIVVEAGKILGPIIISERPSTKLSGLLIRWGGELANKLTDANSE